MLSLIELENLFEILNQTENTLEGCFAIFNKYFASDYFKPCFVIMQLTIDNVNFKNWHYFLLFWYFLVFDKDTKINRFFFNE